MIVEGNALWVNQGIYKIERLQAADESQHCTTVYKHFMGRRAEIPEDLVRGMTMKYLEVHQNFSLDSAYVMVLTGDTLVLESLFPRIHQMGGIRRRRSHDRISSGSLHSLDACSYAASMVAAHTRELSFPSGPRCRPCPSSV